MTSVLLTGTTCPSKQNVTSGFCLLRILEEAITSAIQPFGELDQIDVRVIKTIGKLVFGDDDLTISAVVDHEAEQRGFHVVRQPHPVALPQGKNRRIEDERLGRVLSVALDELHESECESGIEECPVTLPFIFLVFVVDHDVE